MTKKLKSLFMYEIEKDRLHNAPEKSVRARGRARIVPESEKTLEAKLRKEVEKRGGMAIKLLSQLHRGLPDRMVLLPGGLQYFVEMKTTGEKPTRLQAHCHQQLWALGFTVCVVDSTEALENFLFIVDCERLERANDAR